MISNEKINKQYGEIFDTAGAQWIGSPGVFGNESAPAPLFRKKLNIEKAIAKAVLSVTGLGQYEGFVNGKALDERIVFAPVISNYQKTVYYNVYDITAQLCIGENTLGFILGRGRYAFNSAGTPWNGETADWIDCVKMIAVLEITYNDGTKATYVTDESWQTKSSGILQDCMYMGETFDARVHDFAWNTSDSTDGWVSCVQVKKPVGKLMYDFSEPIAVTEKISPVACVKLADKTYALEFDKYLTGWIELSVDCPKDTTVSIYYTERKNAEGYPYINGSIVPGGRLQKDFFISTGEKVIYRPMFSYKGFRYVLVEGMDDLKVSDAVGCFVHSDIQSIATLACSDDLITWIHHAVRRTILSNFHGLSTDTPVYEKLGWGGDAAAISPSVLYNFDARKFYRKWAKDFLDCQTEDGEISVINPTHGWGLTGKTRWQAVCGPTPTADLCWAEIVYRLYWCYGDMDALTENYEGLKKYAAYLKNWANGGLCTKGIGDWLPPTGNVEKAHAEPPEGPQIVESAYHIRIMERMHQIALALGKTDDAKEFAQERQHLIDLYNDAYYDAQKGYYCRPEYPHFRQACNVLAIAFGIADGEKTKKVMEHLLQDIQSKDFHTDMGVFTSMYLPIVLTEQGYHDIAYRIVTAKGYPGLDYMRQKGATTMSESWEYDGCRSCCHYALGAVENWIITYLAGIHQLAPGYAKVKIDPKMPEGMDYIQYSLETVRGTIDMKCYRKDGQIVKEISVPETIEMVV